MSTWQDHFPRGVTDPFGPSDEPIFTPTDRRMLWHLEAELAIRAPIGSELDRLARNLRSYLNETCEHHWTTYDAEADIPAHRQCLWCHDVEWTNGDTPR